MQSFIRKVCSKIERRSVNHINWLRTLYFNFRLLPFKEAKLLPFYIYGRPVFNSLSGRAVFECAISKGMVNINEQKPFASSLQTVNSQINLCGTLLIRGKVMIGSGNKIIVAHGAVLDLGGCTKISDFCNVDCWSTIVIGDGSTIAHRCQLMDSNHHFIFDTNLQQISNNMRPIYIGKNSWVCNSSTIVGGGNNSRLLYRWKQ